jgi:hypothetical protein
LQKLIGGQGGGMPQVICRQRRAFKEQSVADTAIFNIAMNDAGVIRLDHILKIWR